jgi:hypothetical protein
MNRYVIFREDAFNTIPGKEIYVDAIQNPNSTLVETTNQPSAAMTFQSARDAYDWGGIMGLDWWRVGIR